jgi:hypothetical protein
VFRSVLFYKDYNGTVLHVTDSAENSYRTPKKLGLRLCCCCIIESVLKCRSH